MLNGEQMAMFDGLMLGDAHVTRSACNSGMSFRLKHRSFLEEIVKRMPFSWGSISPSSYFDERTDKTYRGFWAETHVDKFLTEQRVRWYPAGEKMVPTDVDLSPTSLLWWYLGDGYLCVNKNRPDARRVNLATMGFAKPYRTFLIERLKTILGPDNIYEEDACILISKQALCSFIEMVGTVSPVKDYDYKFEFGNYTDRGYFRKIHCNKSSVLDFGNRMRKCNSMKVVRVEDNAEFDSMTEAANASKCSISGISWAVKNKCKLKGFNWKTREII